MSELSKWAERCYADGIEVWRFEHESDITGLYMTKKKIGDGIPCYSWTTPIYHVWVRDKCVLSCMNYREAYDRYGKEKNNGTL